MSGIEERNYFRLPRYSIAGLSSLEERYVSATDRVKQTERRQRLSLMLQTAALLNPQCSALGSMQGLSVTAILTLATSGHGSTRSNETQCDEESH